MPETWSKRRDGTRRRQPAACSQATPVPASLKLLAPAQFPSGCLSVGDHKRAPRLVYRPRRPHRGAETSSRWAPLGRLSSSRPPARRAVEMHESRNLQSCYIITKTPASRGIFCCIWRYAYIYAPYSRPNGWADPDKTWHTDSSWSRQCFSQVRIKVKVDDHHRRQNGDTVGADYLVYYKDFFPNHKNYLITYIRRYWRTHNSVLQTVV